MHVGIIVIHKGPLFQIDSRPDSAVDEAKNFKVPKKMAMRLLNEHHLFGRLAV